MAIQYNDITAIGDVFIIKANKPIIGIKYILGYIDDVLNETIDRYFKREFRVSRNGITYTDWKPLTNDSLQNEFVGVTDIFDIQYRYTRAGTDDTGYLTFNSIELTGLIEEVENPKVFTDLYFNKFFNYNDDSVLRWSLNVLNKLYNRGIIANYIERGEITNEQDEDFLAFFGAITHFFAIIVRYAREFENFTLNDVLLLEYLRQKNVFLCGDMSFEGLQEVLANLYINFLERGTGEIVKLASETDRVVDGELMRLICKKDVDEFLFGLIEQEKIIWNVNNNSPLYKGTKGAINLIKAYEFEKNVQSLSNYPLLNESFITKYADGDNDTIRILNVTGTTISGIGDAENQSKLILIDPRMNYEVTFYVKQAVLGDYLHLKVNVYDKDEALLLDCPISAVDGSQTSLSIDKKSLNRNDVYYFVRLLLFSQITEHDSKYVLDVGFGNHLIINNSDAKYMSIELGSDVVGGGSYDGNNDLRIWDFKVSPAIENYANGFVMIPNMLVSYLENNSEFTNQNIENKIKRFLLPYNTIFKNQFLDELFTPTGVPLQITVVKTDETVIGAQNGTITINAVGGTQPYIYSIDNGVTFFDTNVFIDLAPGSYDIVVEDSLGIQVTDSVTINAGISSLSLEVFSTPSTTPISNDGTITILASGGISPYYYSIDGISYQVSNVFGNISSGNYTVYLKDSIDNVVSDIVEVGVIRENLVTFTLIGRDTLPVSGVNINVIGEDYTTNGSGEASIYLADGGYSFIFSKSGYRTEIFSYSITSDRSITVSLYIVHKLTYNIISHSINRDVRIRSISTPTFQNSIDIYVSYNDSVILNLLEGDYTFEFSAIGVIPEIDIVNLIADIERTIDLTD